VRTLVTFSLGTEASNRALRDGSLPKLMEAFMRDYKPEAAYFFTSDSGERGGLFVVDLADPSVAVQVAEFFWLMAVDAHVTLRPAINLDDLRTGLERVLQ
jgi:hypothetical protein